MENEKLAALKARSGALLVQNQSANEKLITGLLAALLVCLIVVVELHGTYEIASIARMLA